MQSHFIKFSEFSFCDMFQGSFFFTPRYIYGIKSFSTAISFFCHGHGNSKCQKKRLYLAVSGYHDRRKNILNCPPNNYVHAIHQIQRTGTRLTKEIICLSVCKCTVVYIPILRVASFQWLTLNFFNGLL